MLDIARDVEQSVVVTRGPASVVVVVVDVDVVVAVDVGTVVVVVVVVVVVDWISPIWLTLWKDPAELSY